MKIWMLTFKDRMESYSSSRFKEEAQKMGIELSLVAPEDFDIIVTKGGTKSVSYKGEPVTLPDCVIPRMGASTTYFALALLRHFQEIGVFVVNEDAAIEMAKDKLHTMQTLTRNNIPIPKTMLAKFPINIDLVEKEFQYPVIQRKRRLLLRRP